ATHTVVPNPGGATSTTFLLDISNLGATADNFTLGSALQSANPQSGWSVAFGGKPILGSNNAYVPGGNHSILQVTVTAPPGATSGSATVRVSGKSISAPDQAATLDLSVQLSNTLTHGVSVFVGPEPSSKIITRSGDAVFNYTVWNRGTEPDAFSVSCVSGPDMTVKPVTFERNNPNWNGSISGPSGTIQCVDPNTTRVVTLNLAPGAVSDVQLFLQHNANDTSQYFMRVQVQAKSQKDADKSDIGTASAQVVALASFGLKVLTDGLSNADDPTSDHASLVMRYGKDDPTVCPNPGTPQSAGNCNPDGSGNEGTLPGTYNSAIVQQQALDTNYTQFAFYRISIFNDGDVVTTYTPNITRVANTIIPGGDCESTVNSFDAVKRSQGAYGMGDATPNKLLFRPTTQDNPDTDIVAGDGIHHGTFPLNPGQTAIFYLRVRNEWNRMNLSVFSAGSSIGATTGKICDSQSIIEVTVTSDQEPRPSRTITATTIARNTGTLSDLLPKNVVVTDGARDTSSPTPSVLTTDIPQACPPVTLEGSGDRLLCRYVKPGESTTWSFTVSKVNPMNDTLVIGPLFRTIGSITDLRNRGWVIPDRPTVDAPEDAFATPATGEELRVHITIGVPKNATVSDFAGLTFQANMLLGSSNGRPISFFTVGAQKFAVKVTNLAGAEPIKIHPGDRAAVNLNVSNEGASVDIYNFTYVSNNLPNDWAQPTFEPNETRISPSHNKTVTVFLQSPRVLNVPTLTLPTQTVEVHSLVNTTRERGGTFDLANFDVSVVPRQPEDLTLTVDGLELRPIDPGKSVAFSLNVTNPSPSAVKVRLSRLPVTLVTLVDGWADVVGESCFSMNGHETKQVSFTVTAARDATEDTHVTYVLRAELAQSDCTVAATNTNFAQALARVQVIGKAGLDLQALDPVKVVPRGGSAAFPVRVRNFGTATDSFFFNPTFVNQSQPLPPNPWSVDVRTAEGEVVQNLTVDPGFSRIVFVNLSAPVNIPTTGVRSDLNFGASGTSGVTASTGLTAFVQDYDLRIRIPNATVDAIPGQTLFFTLNMTNAGNGLDTFDIQMDVGGLAGFWNVSSEFSAVTLLNGTSRDVQLSVQVPKSPLPTTGAVIGVTVRSRQAESIRPQAEALGLGSPIVALLNAVPKTSLVQVNLFPYVSIDVDGDREPELAVDRNRNALD
ncbi:MAG: hypothetical protein LC624_05150, partial [Halobacteriales archaeon]|nr:hypothetical protein [Halobacteriales archaeon]